MYTYTAGSPKTFGALGAPRPIDVMGPGFGTYLQEGRPLSYAPRFGEEADSGGGWSDAINAAITGTASLFQLSTQAKLQKQAQHEAAREAAHRRELEKTQALYLASGSIKPAQGSVVTVQSPGGGLGAGRWVAIAGVLIGGGTLLYVLRQKRRRR